jgi:hypothetical protein
VIGTLPSRVSPSPEVFRKVTPPVRTSLGLDGLIREGAGRGE